MENHPRLRQDMEATLGEDVLSCSMVKKCAGKFKRGKESVEDNAHPERQHIVSFTIFNVLTEKRAIVIVLNFVFIFVYFLKIN